MTRLSVTLGILMKYYKALTAENKGPYSGFDFSPYLPKNGKPGKWLPVVKTLEMCESGWHGCTAKQLLKWLNANIYEVEIRGKVKREDDKFCAEQMRLVRRVMGEREIQLLACNYAEHVLHFYEDKYPNDPRVRRCIETARNFANGKASDKDRAAAWAAAQDAAQDAAWAVAWDAAWDAEETWQQKRLQHYLRGGK